MSITDCLSWLSEHLIFPLFNFPLSFWGITFGSLVVALFGIPLLVRAIKKFF